MKVKIRNGVSKIQHLLMLILFFCCRQRTRRRLPEPTSPGSQLLLKCVTKCLDYVLCELKVLCERLSLQRDCAFCCSDVTTECQLGAAITLFTPEVIKTPFIITLSTLTGSLKETGLKVNPRSQEKL